MNFTTTVNEGAGTKLGILSYDFSCRLIYCSTTLVVVSICK
jgi:hypothetical protein